MDKTKELEDEILNEISGGLIEEANEDNMKDLKNSIKDDELDGVSGGLDITTQGAKKNLIDIEIDLYKAPTNKRRLPRKFLDTDAEGADTLNAEQANGFKDKM